MKLGVVFPHWAIKSDPIVIKDFAQAVEGMGYDYILQYETVVDTKSERPPAGWHEPFTLIGFMAGCTSKLEFATGVVVLPSRQTVLVAKQVAELDILTNGRLRFGVSVGWNPAEYQAMGVKKEVRGDCIEEQIAVLRKLWTEDFVTFEGKYHQMKDVGIYPRPVQKPIPVWLGGYADSVMRRIAKIGDGWMMYNETPESAKDKMATLYTYIAEAGRKPEDVQLNVVGVEVGEDNDWGKVVTDWEAVGASYLDVSTWRGELKIWDDHLNAIQRFKESVDGK